MVGFGYSPMLFSSMRSSVVLDIEAARQPVGFLGLHDRVVPLFEAWGLALFLGWSGSACSRNGLLSPLLQTQPPVKFYSLSRWDEPPVFLVGADSVSPEPGHFTLVLGWWCLLNLPLWMAISRWQ